MIFCTYKLHKATNELYYVNSCSPEGAKKLSTFSAL